MDDSKTQEVEQVEVTCRVCHKTYVPSPLNDFYLDGDNPKIGRCERCLISEEFKKSDPVVVPTDKIGLLCKPGQGVTTCSFLLAGRDGFMCSKGTGFQAEIDKRRAAGTMGAKGNNCSGPPHYKPIAS